MSLYDYFTGTQSWKDHVNNRDLGRRFETALTKSGDRLALQLNSHEHQQAIVQGLGSITEGFSEAVSDLRYEIVDVSSGIDRLRADFNILMGEAVWKLELQNTILSNMLRTLQAPLDTAAKELRARAEDAYRNGWYEEALSDFLQSEEKNYQDFSVQRSVGNIYLYHLVDLPSATEYFAKAAKYARPRDPRQAAEAEFFVGVTYGLQQKHEDGLRHLEEAVNLNPAFSEAHYIRASFAALLRRAAVSTASLNAAIVIDPRYYHRCLSDACFDAVRDAVAKTLDELEQRQKALAVRNLDYLQNVIRVAREYQIGSPAIDDARRGHEQLTKSCAKGTYVEYVTAVHRSVEFAKAVVEGGQKVLDERIQQLSREIEQRKGILKNEIRQQEGRLGSIRIEQSRQKSPAQTMAFGTILLALGITFMVSSRFDAAGIGGGLALVLLGGIVLIAGLGHALRNGRRSDKISSLESDIAHKRSTLERGRDPKIFTLTDRIRVAESGREALGNLEPTEAIQPAQASRAAFVTSATSLADEEVWDSLT